MDKHSKLLTIVFLSLTITACDFLNNIIGQSNYSGYEEYFTNELKYEKSTDMDSFNKALDEGAYWWRTYESDTSTSYYTSKGWLVFFNNSNKELSSIRFLDANRINVYENENGHYFQIADYTALSVEGEYWNGTKGVSASEEQQKNLQMHKYEDNSGYLVVAYEKYMFYVTSDFKDIYVNETNTKTFNNANEEKVIADCDLLNNYLTVFGEDKRLTLPAPEGKDIEIWHGKDYYKDHMSHYTAYFADVEPADYAETLKKNGFTVIRSYEDPFYAFYQSRGGFWYCYDEKAEIKILVSASDYLYINNVGKSYGPWHNTEIWFYKMSNGYFGENEQNTAEDWSDSDKEIMNSWYDGKLNVIIPFVKLGSNYHVPTDMSLAHTGILDGTLMQDHMCYNITDGSRVYYLDGYDKVLEANGYHKYEYGFDVDNDFDARSAFMKTEECKYAECYINEEKNVAIKYYFDTNNGNTIRVFKLDEMKSLNVENPEIFD